MQTVEIANTIDAVCEKIRAVSDFLWASPTECEWYGSIPVLGRVSAAVILLIGSGIYFSIRLRFIQVRKFGQGIKLIVNSQKATAGISPLASFLLSTAMRIGPGNIVGVTGAISVGGPGALFWMWVSAFFGMSTAFVESTLAQIFKERKEDNFYGGFAHYGRKLLNDSTSVGIILSVVYITYSLLCLPAQSFNTISSVGQIANILSGHAFMYESEVVLGSSAVLVIFLILITFHGIKGITKVTNAVVPVMSVLFAATVLILVIMNTDRIPYFVSSVFEGAFRPEAAFGGMAGTCIAQGIKRGLMSNEAGQGTITMAAATSEVRHPCEQGCIQSIGVFLDTMVIATLSAFVVIMGQMWNTAEASEWMAMGKLDKFIASAAELSPSHAMDVVSQASIAICFGLFAFTCLVGFISMTEISAARISSSRSFINFIRIACLSCIAFGLVTEISGLDLSSLWNLSDLANLVMVIVNIPLLYVGFSHVLKASRHFERCNGGTFSGSDIGLDLKVWGRNKSTTTK